MSHDHKFLRLAMKAVNGLSKSSVYQDMWDRVYKEHKEAEMWRTEMLHKIMDPAGYTQCLPQNSNNMTATETNDYLEAQLLAYKAYEASQEDRAEEDRMPFLDVMKLQRKAVEEWLKNK